jgi:hypothetical protein
MVEYGQFSVVDLGTHDRREQGLDEALAEGASCRRRAEMGLEDRQDIEIERAVTIGLSREAQVGRRDSDTLGRFPSTGIGERHII